MIADQSDRATAREEEMREDAIAAIRMQLPSGPGEEVCQICDEPIPADRRAALPGVSTCVACQRDLDRGLRPWEFEE